MPRVPSAQAAAEKFSRVAPTRQQDYEAGVSDPGVDWAASTAGARESWEAGVQDAAQRGAFTRGVQKSGNDRWRAKTKEVGASRWAPGIRLAQQDYQDAMGPVLQVIERTQIPPRGPRGDPRNIERVAALARSLSDYRKSR